MFSLCSQFLLQQMMLSGGGKRCSLCAAFAVSRDPRVSVGGALLRLSKVTSCGCASCRYDNEERHALLFELRAYMAGLSDESGAAQPLAMAVKQLGLPSSDQVGWGGAHSDEWGGAHSDEWAADWIWYPLGQDHIDREHGDYTRPMTAQEYVPHHQVPSASADACAACTFNAFSPSRRTISCADALMHIPHQMRMSHADHLTLI